MLAAAAALMASATAVGAATGAFPSLKAAVRGGETPPAPQADHELPLLGSDDRQALASFRGRVVVVTFVRPTTQDRARSPLACGSSR